jgi:type II secretory pathway component GspD/PulD (secretin)
MSTSEFVVVTKLPLLGDIPILGYLFKNKRVEKAQSQIIFFIEPRVVKREYGWTKREEE